MCSAGWADADLSGADWTANAESPGKLGYNAGLRLRSKSEW